MGALAPASRWSSEGSSRPTGWVLTVVSADLEDAHSLLRRAIRFAPSMKVATTLLFLGCLLGSALAHRTLLAPSPTEMLNAQRKQQAQQQVAQVSR